MPCSASSINRVSRIRYSMVGKDKMPASISARIHFQGWQVGAYGVEVVAVLLVKGAVFTKLL